MAITDAQFDQWLLTPGKRTVLVELAFAYESGGAPAIGTIYLANRAYITEPTDSPASVAYRDVIRSTPRFRRALDRGSLGGQARLSISDLVLDNADKSLDFLLEAVLDGYEVRFFLGDKDWARADFRVVLVAVAERIVAPSEVEIVVKLRDKRLLLDRPVQGNAVGGSGVDSTKYLPLLVGSHFNVEALIYDAAALEYAVVSNYLSSSLAIDVRDSGASLRSGGWSATAANTTVVAGTDTFTHTAHGLAVDDVIFFADPVIVGGTYLYWAPFPGMSATPYWVKTVPTADTFTLSATKGGATLDITGTTWSDSGSGSLAVVRQRFFDDLATTGRVKLSSTPSGRITVDVLNAGNITAPFAFAKVLIDSFGGLTSGEVDSAAFDAADVALDAKISLGYSNYSVMERANLLDVLDDLVYAAFGWYGSDYLGRITCGLVDVSGIASATPTRALVADDLTRRGLVVENAPATTSRANVEYDLNHTLQVDGLAAGVSVSNRRDYAKQYRKVQRSTAPTGTAYSTNKPLYHRTMVEAEPGATVAMSPTAYGTDTAIPIGDYADEIVADLAPWRQFITCEGFLHLYDWALGDVVEITYPRYGLDAGANARLIGIEVDLGAGAVLLDLVRQVSPDVTTASHY